MKFGLVASLATALWAGIGVVAQVAAVGTISKGPFPDDLNGSNKTYDFPVEVFQFTAQQQQLQVAFTDVKPCNKPNGYTVVLLHGKNFCGCTWREQTKALSKAGYRVIAIDNLGFCKSSKPSKFQYSLNQYAWIIKGLLNTLGLDKVIIMTHSYGGMIGTRFALQNPDSVHFLFVIDAVGLEDYTAKGVPYISIDDSVAQEATSNYDSIRGYEQRFYYNNQWDSRYDEWVNMLVAIYWGSQRQNYLMTQALTVDVVLDQPIAADFGSLEVPTFLLVGEADSTFIGQWAPASVTAELGKFSVLGPQVCSEIKRCTFHQFANMGHAPQITNATLFNQVMLEYFAQGVAAL